MDPDFEPSRAIEPSTMNDPMPVAPAEPEAGDCCGEGCVPCVFDVYEQALDRYRTALAAWRQRHPQAPAGADR